MIVETLIVGPFMANCYVVAAEQGDRAMVIDPGGDSETILQTLDKLSLKAELIVITHAHVDHVAAAQAVKDATGATLVMHEAEGQSRAMEAISRMLGPLLGAGLDKGPAPDRLLKDGDTLQVNALSFQVLHTPGHSPGGISIAGQGVVFTGDTLFNFGIGRTDFPGCSYEDLIRSIREKLFTLPDSTKVYPGHGPATTIGVEKQWNPFLRV